MFFTKYASGILASISPGGSGTRHTKYRPGLRMNQIQVIGTHNSYHKEVSLEEQPWHAMMLDNPQDYYYSHATLDAQLADQSVRGLELDIWADPEGGRFNAPLINRLAGLPLPSESIMNQSGSKILHVPDADVGVTCYTLIECLTVIRDWSRSNPDHVPIPILIEFKYDNRLNYIGGATTLPWDDVDRLDALDEEFRSVFGPDEMITPDNVRDSDLTLEHSILTHGWPTLDWARGKVMFLMDDAPYGLGAVRDAYTDGHPNLEGRVIFTQSVPGESDCAFQKLNEPTGDYTAYIQEQVRKNYWVRTRADEPIRTVLAGDTEMRDAAFASGAHFVSTDFPVIGMAARWTSNYVVRWPGGAPARCNPITAPDGCGGVDNFEPNYQP